MKQFLLAVVLLLTFVTGFAQSGDSLYITPNPFVNSTIIHFNLGQADTISLQVFDRWGGTVKIYFHSSILAAGNYQIRFNGDTLPDGSYVVILEIGSSKTLGKYAIKNTATGVIENSRGKPPLLLSPNPVKDELKIPFEGTKTIIIADLDGKIFRTIKSARQQISLFGLPPGLYFISILSEKQEIIHTQKILKIE